MPKTPHYHINVFYSEEDGGWIAAVPDLQNANAFGDTPDEAISEIQVVMDMWHDSWMEKHGDPPPAVYQPLSRAAG